MNTFNLTNTNPINELITNLSLKKSSTNTVITYNELKQELLQKVDNKSQRQALCNGTSSFA